MPVFSTLCFLGAIAFAITVGPQTRPWTWGPAMLCLASALLMGLPRIWRERSRLPGPLILTMSLATIAWLCLRMHQSPVSESALSDLLLLACAVGALGWARLMDGHRNAQRVFHLGIASILSANLVVMFLQWKNPGFIPLFDSIPVNSGRTGFFAHYIECANFLVATSMWTAAAALWGPHSRFSRIVMALIAITGLAGVAMSGGRGGVVGASVACVTFLFMMLLQAKKRDAKWFAPAIIAVPLLAALTICYLLFGWSTAIQARNMNEQKVNAAQQMDNHARLHAIGIAWDSISKHPLQGGGSRSFGWEASQSSHGKTYGDMTTHRLEFVHNEFLQAAADYGILGVLLICITFTCIFLNAVNSTLFSVPRDALDSSAALHLGGIAAFTGLLAQACFSFTFHLLPGVLLLGTSLGMILMPIRSGTSLNPATIRRTLFSVPMLCGIGLLFYFGYRGTVATRILWKSEYGKSKGLYADSRADRLAQAIEWWPDSSLYGLRAMIFHESAGSPEEEVYAERARKALEEYQKAHEMNPFEPVFAINTANIFSNLGDDPHAEMWYDEAISIQGVQEPAFMGHLSCASHYLRKGIKSAQQGKQQDWLAAMERAAHEIETNVEQMHWLNPQIQDLRLVIHGQLGLSREAAGDMEGALASYRFASELRNGRGYFYQIARLQTKMAHQIWNQHQPEKALSLFQKAKSSIDKCHNELPSGVTKQERWRLTAHIEKTIQFLKTARVQAAD